MSLNDSSCAPAHNTPLPLERAPPASFKRLLGTALRQSGISHMHPALYENLAVDLNARTVANQERVAREPPYLDQRSSNPVRGNMTGRRRRNKEDISSLIPELVAGAKDRNVGAERRSGTTVPNEKNGLVLATRSRVRAEHIVGAKASGTGLRQKEDQRHKTGEAWKSGDWRRSCRHSVGRSCVRLTDRA